MKKRIVYLVLALTPLFGFSQSIFDRFEDYDEVTSVVVSQKAFELLAKMDVDIDDKDAKDFMDIATSLSSLKVFTTEDAKIGAEMKATVDKYLGSTKLTELMRIKDKDANVKFYIKEGKDSDHVSELLMFMTDINKVKIDDRNVETVLLTLTGNIDLNKISSLTKKMNLPEELNEAGNKKG